MKIRRDALDLLFSKYIRLRASNHCEYCGAYKDFRQLQVSHFIGRRKRNVRYDPENACALDFSCHAYLQEHPYQHTEFFKKRLGSERFEELNIRAEMIVKLDEEWIKTDLKEKIRLLEEE